MLAAENLTTRFGDATDVGNLQLSIAPGELFALRPHGVPVNADPGASPAELPGHDGFARRAD